PSREAEEAAGLDTAPGGAGHRVEGEVGVLSPADERGPGRLNREVLEGQTARSPDLEERRRRLQGGAPALRTEHLEDLVHKLMPEALCVGPRRELDPVDLLDLRHLEQGRSDGGQGPLNRSRVRVIPAR